MKLKDYVASRIIKSTLYSTVIYYIRDRGQMAYFRENLRTHVAPTKFYDN